MIVFPEGHEITLGDILDQHKLHIQNYKNACHNRCKIGIVRMKV